MFIFYSLFSLIDDEIYNYEKIININYKVINLWSICNTHIHFELKSNQSITFLKANLDHLTYNVGHRLELIMQTVMRRKGCVTTGPFIP